MSAAILREAAMSIRADCPIPEQSRGYDFIDFPTGFAIQRAGVEHVAECSAKTTGGAMLCDCEAIYPAWRRWRTMLAVADWLDAAYADWQNLETSLGATSVRSMSGEANEPDQRALAAARAYLGDA